MGIRPHVVGVLVASLLGLGHPSADPAPGWVVLTISRVQVKPKKIDGGTERHIREDEAGGAFSYPFVF